MQGQDVVKLARQHVGDPYAFGVRANLEDPDYQGPWDCAEFASWCVYQCYQIKFGLTVYGDPYTGAWIEQGRRRAAEICPDLASYLSGAFLIRAPRAGLPGHVAISDGQGGTIEALNRNKGVVSGRIQGRHWDAACLLPGVRYESPELKPLVT